MRWRMPCLPPTANSGEYLATGASTSSSPRSTSISAARLVTVLLDDQTLVMVCSDHGTVRASSQKPPHMSMTSSPSMPRISDAPSSLPESRFWASAPRTASKRSSHLPCTSAMVVILLVNSRCCRAQHQGQGLFQDRGIAATAQGASTDRSTHAARSIRQPGRPGKPRSNRSQTAHPHPQQVPVPR
jgi:hypothetical protein